MPKRGKKRKQNEDESQGDCLQTRKVHRNQIPPASKLMEKFEDQLRGGKFRHLNEQLYCSTGADSFARFQKDAELFREYHDGYLESMKSWTIQPISLAIRWLKKQKSQSKVVDYGCGEAKIMNAPTSHFVTSLDFIALDPRVIACDMAHSPLESASHDIAIFSLALMGTNYHESLIDASRVVKVGGLIWIAEVCSRFANKQGKEDYQHFFDAMDSLGFEKTFAKKPSKLFVVLIFKKVREVKRKERIRWPFLKPCLYKRR